MDLEIKSGVWYDWSFKSRFCLMSINIMGNTLRGIEDNDKFQDCRVEEAHGASASPDAAKLGAGYRV